MNPSGDSAPPALPSDATPEREPRTARDTLMLVLLAGTAFLLLASVIADVVRGLLR